MSIIAQKILFEVNSKEYNREGICLLLLITISPTVYESSFTLLIFLTFKNFHILKNLY